MFEFFTKTKDFAISTVGKATLQKWLVPYGTMLDLKIDTQTQSISVSVQLKGETEPVSLKLTNYHLEESDGKTWISFDPAQLTISREWMQQLVASKLTTTRLEIPPHLSWLVKMLA